MPRLAWATLMRTVALALTQAFKRARGLQLPEVLVGSDGGGAASHQQASFDVPANPGLGEVRAADQQDLVVGDGQLGVHPG